jgi:hypothetical protein
VAILCDRTAATLTRELVAAIREGAELEVELRVVVEEEPTPP